MGYLKVTALFNKNVFRLELNANDVKQFKIMDQEVDSPDRVYEFSITSKLVIVTASDRDFRNGAKTAPWKKDDRRINNINAYDWDGNVLWNIGDIVGDIKTPFLGGWVTTKEILQEGGTEVECPASHDLFMCFADARRYIIDLEERKVVKVETGKF